MLINSPSNPTGQAFDSDSIEMISTFCRERGITLISDEIYSDISFTPDPAPSPASHGGLDAGQIILTGGLSKARTQPLHLLPPANPARHTPRAAGASATPSSPPQPSATQFRRPSSPTPQNAGPPPLPPPKPPPLSPSPQPPPWTPTARKSVPRTKRAHCACTAL
jgi:hypothetical protein